MCCFVFILFWENKTINLKTFISIQRPFATAMFILCAILPMFNFFNLWDSFLSASIYSGNTKTAKLYIRKDALIELNPVMGKYVRGIRDPHYYLLDFNSWSYAVMNVPSYPEIRVFTAITKSLCFDVVDKKSMELVISEPNWRTGVISKKVYNCEDL
jgi:hypothetical protein